MLGTQRAKTQRLFVATSLNGSAKDALEGWYPQRHALEAAWSLPVRVRWVKPEHWHLTWLFLGEQPVEQEDTLIQTVAGIATAARRMTLEMRNLEFWPRPGLPNTLVWRPEQEASQEGFSDLQTLYRDLREALPGPKAFPDFKPHLTLARMKAPRLKQPLSLPEEPLAGVWELDVLTLYRSILKPEGPEYQALGYWPLSP